MKTPDEREAAAIARMDYRHWYNRGWVATSDLDYADAKGYTEHDGYLDGRTDRSLLLPKYHSETCPETHGHDGCAR